MLLLTVWGLFSGITEKRDTEMNNNHKWYSNYRVGKQGEDCEMNLQGLDTCCALSLGKCEGDDSNRKSECEEGYGRCFHKHACDFCKEHRKKHKGHYYYPERNK